jgi:hypothetical protein
MSGMTTDQLQTGLQGLQNTMNQNEYNLYEYSAKSSFANTMAQQFGDLATNAAKAKPQV